MFSQIWVYFAEIYELFIIAKLCLRMFGCNHHFGTWWGDVITYQITNHRHLGKNKSDLWHLTDKVADATKNQERILIYVGSMLLLQTRLAFQCCLLASTKLFCKFSFPLVPQWFKFSRKYIGWSAPFKQIFLLV